MIIKKSARQLVDQARNLHGHGHGHGHFMQHALTLAKRAESEGEVPVGAVIVKNNEIISEGWNQPIQSHDPSAHAEMIAIRNAAKKINNYRLTGCTMIVTLEPCVMCLGAMIHARIGELVFGAYDPKTGAVKSAFQLLGDVKHNHHISWIGGVEEKACGDILRQFFQERRLSS